MANALKLAAHGVPPAHWLAVTACACIYLNSSLSILIKPSYLAHSRLSVRPRHARVLLSPALV